MPAGPHCHCEWILSPRSLGGRNEIRDLASCPHYGKLCVPLDSLNACVSFWKLGVDEVVVRDQ